MWTITWSAAPGFSPGCQICQQYQNLAWHPQHPEACILPGEPSITKPASSIAMQNPPNLSQKLQITNNLSILRCLPSPSQSQHPHVEPPQQPTT